MMISDAMWLLLRSSTPQKDFHSVGTEIFVMIDDRVWSSGDLEVIWALACHASHHTVQGTHHAYRYQWYPTATSRFNTPVTLSLTFFLKFIVDVLKISISTYSKYTSIRSLSPGYSLVYTTSSRNLCRR